MESKICMNGLCGASSSVEWKKGWPLRSGELANLCDKCGTAYEQLTFCDAFHLEETGWRECSSCGKRLHCGCLASSSFIELLDSGGIHCINCKKRSESQPATSDEKPKVFGMLIENSVGETQSSSMENQNSGEDNGQRHLIPPQNENTFGSMKQEEFLPHQEGEIGTAHLSSILNQVYTGSSHGLKSEINTATKDVYISPVQTNLTISLAAAPSRNPNFYRLEERELSKTISSFQQGSRSRHLLPKAPKSVVGDANAASTVSQIRVARPPVEGRVKNQLLPRYWPRITEQELQQISGDSNATIVPLFEKVLSASDAGRIGRLVLPKACAEAYFPHISQPEGLPLRIQDVKGKEWVFQFRFWPNNNSRMYVLEGVTPCIQSMQLQAGDTVTFSRMDPEGKLLMGFRKATNTIPLQDTHVVSPMHNNGGGGFSSERCFFQSGVVENLPLPIMSGYSGLLQSLKGSSSSADPNVNAYSKHLGSSPNGDFGSVERKRSRNIGSKSKRLVIDSQDALQLKLTWEEVQDMLRPPISVKPSTVTIEDHEFEEYEEPPVLGKSSIFTARISGVQEQWAPCDNCCKWRRLPADFLLPPKWTCQDNIWDQSRCSCSAPDELSPKELEILLKMNKEYKKRRIGTSHRPGEENESATTLDKNVSEVGGSSTSVAATTRHPRHRPGCSCIVCIQPPSGKGKHKPTCTCNVCMTVKRRFKTLMMRKKKRQSEREAEITAQRNNNNNNQFAVWGPKEEESEVDSISRQVSSSHYVDPSENEATCELELQQQQNGELAADSGKGGELDLNCHPHREEDRSTSRVSMMSLFKVANLPLETYLKQNGLTSLICEQQQQQPSSGSHAVPQPTGESEGQLQEQQSRGDDQEENFEPAESQNSPS